MLPAGWDSGGSVPGVGLFQNSQQIRQPTEIGNDIGGFEEKVRVTRNLVFGWLLDDDISEHFPRAFLDVQRILCIKSIRIHSCE